MTDPRLAEAIREVQDDGTFYEAFAQAIAATEPGASLLADAETGRRVEPALTVFYQSGDGLVRRVIGQLCDEYLDRSGAMLGRIRDAAIEDVLGSKT